MVSASLQSLKDLCYIRIAYLMWTRRAVAERCPIRKSYEKSEDAILDDITKIPLPAELEKLGILKLYVPPVGKCLLSLLSFWFSTTQPEKSCKQLAGDILYESLVLNGDGLINERRTAEKLLSNRMLDNIFAFRLACINFLQKEVLKLWIHVKVHFLNKIMLENAQHDHFERRRSSSDSSDEMPDFSFFPNTTKYPCLARLAELSSFPFTTEPLEVLFWIGYCLSKDNEIDIKEVPHFAGNGVNWYDFCLELAAFTGNVACFDYFINFSNTMIEYNYVDMIEKILVTYDDNQQTCFIFHFRLLNLEEKIQLFLKFPEEMISHFLQWPLSLTFAENPKEIWSFIPDEHKPWVFYKIFSILFNKYIKADCMRRIVFCLNGFFIFGFQCRGLLTGIYNKEQLKEIWISLWNCSLDSFKITVLDALVFSRFIFSFLHPRFHEDFKISDLKQKMIRFLLSNGEAVLELFEDENINESLKSFFAKHIPEDLDEYNEKCVSILGNCNINESLKSFFAKHIPEDLDEYNENCVSILGNCNTAQLVTSDQDTKRGYALVGNMTGFNPMSADTTRIHENFLNYIQSNL